MSRNNQFKLPDNVNWDYLKRFRICANHKSFQMAAQQLSTTNLSLQKQMDALEASLTYQLFTRINKNRTTVLTQAGRTLLLYINDAYEILKMGNPISYEANTAMSRKIWIETAAGLANIIFSNMFEQYSSTHPHHQLRFDIKTNLFPIKAEANKISIRYNFDSGPGEDVRKVFKIPTHLYASQDYINLHGGINNIKDLLDYNNLCLRAPNFPGNDWALLNVHTSPNLPYIRSDNLEFLYKMAINNQGIVELPDISPYSNTLVKVFPDIKCPERSIVISFKSTEFMEVSPTTIFVNYILEWFQQQDWVTNNEQDYDDSQLENLAS